MPKTILLLSGLLMLVPGCGESKPRQLASLSSEPGGLSRDEQVQALLLKRMVDEDEDYFRGVGQTIYVSLGSEWSQLGTEPHGPSVGVMTALGQRPYPIKQLSEYLKSIGGYDQWRQSRELITVLWVGTLKWTDENTVEVSVGRNLGALESHGQILRLRWMDGRWHTEDIGGWKS